jgi:peroxiredoxin
LINHQTHVTMKMISKTATILILFLLPNCSTDAPRYSEKLEKELVGLSRLTLTQKEKNSLLSRISGDAVLDFPVYSLQGEALSRAQIREQEMNMTVDGFGPDTANIKAVVFRSMTKTELDDFFHDFEKRMERAKKARPDLKGKPAPAFVAKDVHGNTVDLAALKGKVVALNFWFIHCHPCVLEMPELNQTVQNFSGKEVVFIGLTFDKEAETKSFLLRRKFDYQIVADAQQVFDRYGGPPSPTNIVIDKNGQVAFVEYGYRPHKQESYKNLNGAINKALGEH